MVRAGGSAVLAEVFSVDRVHGGEIAEVLEEDGGFDDAVEAASASLKHGLEVFEDTGGLLCDATGDDLPGCGIERNLPGCEDEIARAHTLGIRADGRGRCGSCDDRFAHT